MSFDRIAVVDWSATTSVRGGADSVWIGTTDRSGTTVANVPRRREAMRCIAGMIRDAVSAGERLLVGFDFGFGYAAGSRHLPGGGAWEAVWCWLGRHVHDDEDNRSNRFEVANALNRRFLKAGRGAGPFWNVPATQQDRHDALTLRKPVPAAHGVDEYRACELIARAAGRRSQPMWKLFTTGSVGSQSILGMAHLQWLRESELGEHVAVWPYETAFVDRLDERPVALAEVFPSLWPIDVAENEVKDEAQVRTVATGLMRLQRSGVLHPLLAGPSDADMRRTALEHEGWIVGVADDVLPLEPPPAPRSLAYESDPETIYRQSFAEIATLDGLDRFGAARPLAVRLVHACGMPDVLNDLHVSPDAVDAGRAALAGGADIFCDVETVRHGIMARLLPEGCSTHCAVGDAETATLAASLGTTRSAAQFDRWGDRLDGQIVVIGNAPTALFRLLELVDARRCMPALVLAFPVGFVGAAESKAELVRDPRGMPCATVLGRRGGSAMAQAAVNAVAGGLNR